MGQNPTAKAAMHHPGTARSEPSVAKTHLAYTGFLFKEAAHTRRHASYRACLGLSGTPVKTNSATLSVLFLMLQ